MTETPTPRPRIAPWALAAVLFAAPLAWIALQQGEGALVYLACPSSGPPLGVFIGLLSLAACLTVCGLAWRMMKAAERPAQRFIAQVAAGSAAIFALGAAVMTAAIWLVPSCVR